MQEVSNQPSRLPVAVIGAGPVGLAAAAQLIERGFTPLIFEAGATVAAHLDAYRHVRLFSPWRYNVDRSAARLLTQAGWQAPDDEALPYAGEILVQYLEPLSRLPRVASALHLNTRVTRITRSGFDKMKTRGRESAPFVLRAQGPQGEEEFLASAVIDASGTWGTPNPLGSNGLPAKGEERFTSHISYGMPDVAVRERARYAGKRVVVVGAGHSAAGNLIALAQLAAYAPDTRIAWVIRGDNLLKIFGGGENDGLVARGALGDRLRNLYETGRLTLHPNFRIRELRANGAAIDLIGEPVDGAEPVVEAVDEIICATGARPDLSLTTELRTKLDPWIESTEALAPLIDPNVHSCGTVRPHGHRELSHPEPGFYTVGAKSYGRAPNFLMATGYEQVRSIAAALAGDLRAADEVMLELPETGVCSTQFDDEKNSGGKVSASANSESASCATGCGLPADKAAPAPVVAASSCATGCGTRPAKATQAQREAACC